MSDPIHVLRDGQQFGPYSIEQISAMLADGSLLPTDLAWSPTANQWVSIMEVVPAQAAPITATVPSQAGKGKMMMAVGGGVLAVAAAVIFVFFNPFSDGEEKSDPPEKEAKKADENVGGNDETPGEPVVPGREPNEKIPVPPIKPGPAKTTMAEVAKHLDFGGSHFTYTSHEGGLDAANLLAELIDGFSSGPNGLGEEKRKSSTPFRLLMPNLASRKLAVRDRVVLPCLQASFAMWLWSTTDPERPTGCFGNCSVVKLMN